MAAEEDWKEALLRILQARVDSKEETSIHDLVEELIDKGHKKTHSQVQNFLTDNKKMKGRERQREFWTGCNKNKGGGKPKNNGGHKVVGKGKRGVERSSLLVEEGGGSTESVSYQAFERTIATISESMSTDELNEMNSTLLNKKSEAAQASSGCGDGGSGEGVSGVVIPNQSPNYSEISNVGSEEDDCFVRVLKDLLREEWDIGGGGGKRRRSGSTGDDERGNHDAHENVSSNFDKVKVCTNEEYDEEVRIGDINQEDRNIRTSRLHVSNTATLNKAFVNDLRSTNADLAEWREKLDPHEPIKCGDVVQQQGSKVTRRIVEGRGLIFIVSTNPAITLRKPEDEATAEKGVVCAFTGTIPVRVSGGDVCKDDRLYASGNDDGTAVACRDDLLKPFYLGRAMTESRQTESHAEERKVDITFSFRDDNNSTIIQRVGQNVCSQLNHILQTMLPPILSRIGYNFPLPGNAFEIAPAAPATEQEGTSQPYPMSDSMHRDSDAASHPASEEQLPQPPPLSVEEEAEQFLRENGFDQSDLSKMAPCRDGVGRSTEQTTPMAEASKRGKLRICRWIHDHCKRKHCSQ